MPIVLDGTKGEIPASWTTAGRPASPSAGQFGYNTTLGTGEMYTSTGWTSFPEIAPIINSITGGIYFNYTTTLTLNGSNFGSGSGVVTFISGATTEAVNATPSSTTVVSVVVPAAITALSAGSVVFVSFTNYLGKLSNSVSKTMSAVPTGGTITTSGSYRIHTFLSSGNFVVPSTFSSSADYLVVAGGGGGGNLGGGGGAGGYLAGTTTITPNTYAFVIGGGANGGAASTTGGTGSNTTAFGLTALGGGGGGSHSAGSTSTYGANGGSGGGGSDNSSTYGPGSGTLGQGYAGGIGSLSHLDAPRGGGGGGGAGGVGVAINSGGHGGPGILNTINGSSLYWAGGGGCSGYGGTSPGGNGGIGGGGGGSTQPPASAGAGGGSALNSGTSGVSASNSFGGLGGQNTGGGGGGASYVTNQLADRSGGSGIVIVRYLTPT